MNSKRHHESHITPHRPRVHAHAADPPGIPAPDRPPSADIQACLGDLFSVSWIELAARAPLHTMLLQREFERVRLRTSDNNTYDQVCWPLRPVPRSLHANVAPCCHCGPLDDPAQLLAGRPRTSRQQQAQGPKGFQKAFKRRNFAEPCLARSLHALAWTLLQRLTCAVQGSHAQEFGARGISHEVAGDFEGWRPDKATEDAPVDAAASAHPLTLTQHAADLAPLHMAVHNARTARARRAAEAALTRAQGDRQAVDAAMRGAVEAILRQHPQRFGRDPRASERGALGPQQGVLV